MSVCKLPKSLYGEGKSQGVLFLLLHRLTTVADLEMQAHQNTYHVEEIEAFNAKLAAVKDKSMISEEDKEMAKYLGDVHNLANKGIKGRGKGRKVKRVLMLHPPQHQSSPATSSISATGHTGPYQMSLLPHAFSHMH